MRCTGGWQSSRARPGVPGGASRRHWAKPAQRSSAPAAARARGPRRDGGRHHSGLVAFGDDARKLRRDGAALARRPRPVESRARRTRGGAPVRAFGVAPVCRTRLRRVGGGSGKESVEPAIDRLRPRLATEVRLYRRRRLAPPHLELPRGPGARRRGRARCLPLSIDRQVADSGSTSRCLARSRSQAKSPGQSQERPTVRDRRAADPTRPACDYAWRAWATSS